MGSLYVIGTPIGNIKDITLRALEVLRVVDVIACEDTRCTQRLLQSHAIYGKTLFSCHAYNEKVSALKLVRALQEGKNVAYCSDAGTPSLSDPGSVLVLVCLRNNIKVVPIPGISAFSTLVSVSGLFCSHIYFVGFLPRLYKKRIETLRGYLDSGTAFLLYESPYRVFGLLRMIHECGFDRFLVLGREMTKPYEEFLYGTPQEILYILKEGEIRGEISILVASSIKH